MRRNTAYPIGAQAMSSDSNAYPAGGKGLFRAQYQADAGVLPRISTAAIYATACGTNGGESELARAKPTTTSRSFSS